MVQFQSNNSIEAGALLKNGLALLSKLDSSISHLDQSSVIEGDLLYYEDHDRLEVAAEYIQKAAEMEPKNALAWFCWGRAVDVSALNLRELRFDWLTRHFGLLFLPMIPRPYRYDRHVAKIILERRRLAEEKYKTAAGLEAGQVEIWRAWAKNILEQAKLETELEKRRTLLETYWDKQVRISELAENISEVWKDTALGLIDFLPYESDEKCWGDILKIIEDRLDNFFDYAPEKKQPPSPKPGAPKEFSSGDILNVLSSSIGNTDFNEWKKVYAVWGLFQKYSKYSLKMEERIILI